MERILATVRRACAVEGAEKALRVVIQVCKQPPAAREGYVATEGRQRRGSRRARAARCRMNPWCWVNQPALLS